MAKEPAPIPSASNQAELDSAWSSSRDFAKQKPDVPQLARIVNAPQLMPSNGGHYCVLCNLPHGLVCEVDDKRIKLTGSAYFLMPNKDRKFKDQRQHAIFGATPNYVDREFWDKWVAKMTDRKNFPSGYGPIVNGQIIWHQHREEATLIRRDAESVKNGFEQANPAEHHVEKDNTAASSSVVPKITE